MMVYLQYLIPQHALSVIVGVLANTRIVWLKNFFIRWFIKKYKVDMTEAALSNIDAYPTFNAFFIRKLRANLRPIASETDAIISPVDGSVAELGQINHQQLLQAKNFYYDLDSLLSHDAALTQGFENGSFCTLYLAPRQYHRIHMPLAGSLQKTIYVPGKLFSVNQNTVEHIPALYTRNERLIAIFETEVGRMAVIFVGAMIVGNIHTAWSAKPHRASKMLVKEIDPALSFDKGAELGYFSMGSTVILLFEKDKMQWLPTFFSGDCVQFGQILGKIIK